MKNSGNSALYRASGVAAASSRFPRHFSGKLLLLFFLGSVANAAPAEVFLSPELKLPQEPARFWAGEPATLRIFAHRQLADPEIYLLSKALAAPLQVEVRQDRSSRTESGLFLHEFTFTAPEPRLQQRYLLRYPGAGLGLSFDVYPQWLRQQVAGKAAAYSIRIQEPTSQAKDFFAHFQSEDARPGKRPVLEVVPSQQEVLIRVSRNRTIWKTNYGRLDASDPMQTVHFEAILDTLNELNQER